MNKEHHYKLTAQWHGNKGTGTSGVRDYDRSHTVSIANKPALHLTTDNPAVGDKTKAESRRLIGYGRIILPHAFVPVRMCNGGGGCGGLH